MTQSFCTKCNEFKDVSLFCKEPRKTNGIESVCKRCKADYQKLRKAALKKEQPCTTNEYPTNM